VDVPHWKRDAILWHVASWGDRKAPMEGLQPNRFWLSTNRSVNTGGHLEVEPAKPILCYGIRAEFPRIDHALTFN
jgi:hypothetical protein